MRLHPAFKPTYLGIYYLFGVIVLSLLSGVQSFAFSPTSVSKIHHHHHHSSGSSLPLRTTTTPFASSSSSLNCICINCEYVTSCAAYHFVEEKHDQPHMTEEPTFEPQDGSPTIHVNVRTIRPKEQQQKNVADTEIMTEFERMMEEHEQETQTAQELSADGTAALHGSKKYDLTPMTTYEYDVVACADYVEDMGCWVRNMPQAIKDANPHFVPT